MSDTAVKLTGESNFVYTNSLSIRTRHKELFKKNGRRGIESTAASLIIFDELLGQDKMAFRIEVKPGDFVVGFACLSSNPNIKCQVLSCKTPIHNVFWLKLEMMAFTGRVCGLVEKDQGFLIRIRDYLKERYPEGLKNRKWNRIHAFQNHLVDIDTVICSKCGFVPRISRH